MTESIKDSDMAIIGMSCRFPGANNLEALWDNLARGVESIQYFDTPQTPQMSEGIKHISAGSIIDNIEFFDADFFGYSARDAEITDPQHRLFLECAWEAMEDAGCNPHNYQGSIGVYAGSGLNSYYINNIIPQQQDEMFHKNILGSMMNLKLMFGNDKDYLPTLVSYKLNLRGPSINVQTACSTSLVALHLACQGILSGDCDMALVGTSNIIVPQKSGYFYQENMVFSPDGHSRTFDINANGTVFGSGVAAILIKPLSVALDEGDSIYAVIKGTAVNNDGSSKAGYTVPSITGQAAVIEEAIALSEVPSDSITYVEAHGTATQLGDPIEIMALTQAFNSEKKQYCAIGSIKTNFGHLGWTAGMAGLIKTVLSLKYKKIPPTLHYKQVNPKIDFDNTPFYVNTKLSEWDAIAPRRAGVSAFGIGGTNAHVIIEEAPTTNFKKPVNNHSHHILTLSAKNGFSLTELVKRYQSVMQHYNNDEIDNICYTANIGRNHFKHKIAIVVSSCDDAYQQLQSYLSYELPGDPKSSKKNVLVFSGQAEILSLLPQMYDSCPIFRQNIDDYNLLLKKTTNYDLIQIIESNELKAFEQYLFPAVFCIELALSNFLKQLGVKVDTLIGYGVGELSAICYSEAIDIETGLKLSIYLGIMNQSNTDKENRISNFSFTPDQIFFNPSNYEILSGTSGKSVKNEVLNGIYWEKWSQIETNIKACDKIFEHYNLLQFSYDKNRKSWESFLIFLCKAYTNNCLINWELFYKNYGLRKVKLPTYCFNRKKYWVGNFED